MTIRDAAERAVREIREADDFMGTVRDLLPLLWRLWEKHRRDARELRAALERMELELDRGRADVDAALAAKHKDDPK